MKKLKLLFASLALLVGSGTAWAQTDVTSTYLVNPSFEYSASGTASTAQSLTNGGSYYGWSLPNLGTSFVNISIGNSTTCNGQAFGIPNAKEGSFYYFNRRGWNKSSSSDGTLSTTMTSVPVGHYEVTVWYKGYEKYNSSASDKDKDHRTNGSYLKITVVESENTLASAQTDNFDKIDNKDNTSYFTGDDNWKSQSLPFDVTTAGDVTLNIIEHLVGGMRADVIIDNVTLTYENVNGPELDLLIAQATSISSKISSLSSDIETAQAVYDGINDTPEYQETIDNAITTLRNAINTKVLAYSYDAAGDDVTCLVFRPGFEGMTAESANYATVKGKDYSSEGWTMVETGDWGYGAIMAYGSDKTFNGASVPATDNAGNTGNTLGISVGWGWTQRYQSEVITLKAGSYRFSVKAYNANADAQQFTSKVGFVPTSGDPSLSTKTSFASNTWETDEVDIVLASDTEGRFQVGGTAVSGGSGSNAKIFFDNFSLTYFDPLKLAQIQWQTVHDALDALDETALPEAAENAITTELAKSVPTTSADDVNEAKAALQALIDSYADIKAAYEKALALIDLATDEKDNSTGTKTTFATAISTATTDIETRTTAADLTSDYNTLETARQAYVTSGAQPTAGNVFDYTFKIPDAAVTSATDWSNKRTGSGEQYTGAPDNTYFDNYNENRNVQKNIGTLRLGKFELKVATRSEASVTVGNIYVSQNAANLNQTDIHHDGNTGGDLGNGWSWTTVAFDNYVDDKDITLGFYSECGSSKWAGADDFHLYYKGNAVDDETAEVLKGTVVSGKMNATVASAQTTALSEFESAQTFENYNTLKSAIEAASASIAVYEILDAAIAKVEGWTATTAAAGLRTKYNNGEYANDVTAAGIYAEYQAAEIAALAADASAVDWTSVILDHSFESGGMDFWSAISRNDTGVKDQSNGTYSITSGDPVDGLKLFNSWGGTAENNVYQTIKDLPAGTYTLAAVLAGFQEESLVLAANETTNIVVVTGDKTVGYLTTVTFTLDATTDVVIKASNTKSGSKGDASFIKADNFQLYVGSSIPASAYKPTLLLAIDKATNARKSANEGSGAFQIPASAGTTLASAIATAQGVYDNASATVEQVNQATTDINTARTTYENAELNAPANGKLFNVVLTYSGYAYDQKAMTYIANGRSDAGNYNIEYKEAANKNLAQAFTFTKVSGNNYKMSQIDADYAIRYISTGVPYGGNASQIRTTTEADDALIVTVIPTATEGVWNLKNTEANNYIGSQDAGVYTVNSHIDFNIVETTQAAITINTKAAGWGTLMLPFDMSIPTGGKAYTCGAAEGNTLTLVEVEGDLQPNTPYIIEGAWDCIVSGDAQGTDLTYTNGLLTGVYKDTQVPADKFVLQKKSTTVGFYKVAEGKEPTAKANRAYLTAPTAGARFDAFFFGNETTGINAINALLSGKAEIYNLKGEKIDRLQKGMNIIKTNGKIQKVMVK